MSHKMHISLRISVVALLLHNSISLCGIRVASIDEWHVVVEKALQHNLLGALGGNPSASPSGRLVAQSILCASLEKLVPLKKHIQACVKQGKPMHSLEWCQKEVSQERNAVAYALIKKYAGAAQNSRSGTVCATTHDINSGMRNRGVYASHKPLKQGPDGRRIRSRKHHRVGHRAHGNR